MGPEDQLLTPQELESFEPDQDLLDSLSFGDDPESLIEPEDPESPD